MHEYLAGGKFFLYCHLEGLVMQFVLTIREATPSWRLQLAVLLSDMCVYVRLANRP